MTRPEAPVQLGRKRIATRTELEQVVFDLFERQGYAVTTVDEITSAAGSGRADLLPLLRVHERRAAGSFAWNWTGSGPGWPPARRAPR